MRSPLQRAQAKRINPYVGPRPTASGPTVSWWTCQPDQFYAEAKKREAIRQQQVRAVYPDRNDQWDVA